MEDVKRSEEITEMVKTTINFLKQTYPEQNINRDFVQGYLAGYEFGRYAKETSK